MQSESNPSSSPPPETRSEGDGASTSSVDADVPDVDASLQIPASVIKRMRDTVFGFDTFFVTSTENYQADGVLFKGNLRGDAAVAYGKMEARLKVRMWEGCGRPPAMSSRSLRTAAEAAVRGCHCSTVCECRCRACAEAARRRLHALPATRQGGDAGGARAPPRGAALTLPVPGSFGTTACGRSHVHHSGSAVT